jgi:hypothetical protein
LPASINNEGLGVWVPAQGRDDTGYFPLLRINAALTSAR